MPRFFLGHRERSGAIEPPPFAVSSHARAMRVRAALGEVDLDEFSIPDEIVRIGSSYVPYHCDQGMTGTCFAAAPKIGIEQTCAVNGHPIPFDVSVLDIATLVHALERAELGSVDDPLWDWGGDPRDAATVVSRFGVRQAHYRSGMSEEARRCDASPDTVGPDHPPTPDERRGDEPNMLDTEKDAESLVLGIHEIGHLDPIGESVATIADRACLTVAWNATRADMDAAPGTILDGRDGPPTHDSVINAFRRTPDGYLFQLWNSWWPWGDDGNLWVNESFMRCARARYAMSVTRRRAS